MILLHLWAPMWGSLSIEDLVLGHTITYAGPLLRRDLKVSIIRLNAALLLIDNQ